MLKLILPSFAAASIEFPLASGSWGIGWCPEKPKTNVENFSYAKFSGDWYEIIRDIDFLFEPYDECVTTMYYYKPEQEKWKYWVNTVQYTSWKKPPWKIGYVDGNDAPSGS